MIDRRTRAQIALCREHAFAAVAGCNAYRCVRCEAVLSDDEFFWFCHGLQLGAKDGVAARQLRNVTPLAAQSMERGHR